jgi:hypothetical protein
VTAPGATWLDYRLVEREQIRLAMGGFGREVRDALAARANHLAVEGLARRQGPRIVPQRDLLDTLRRRDLDAAGARLSAETGLPYTPAAVGETVAGTYRQRLTLTSGRVAMIDNGVGFALVPWTPALDRHPGPSCLRRRQGRRRRDRVEFRAQARAGDLTISNSTPRRA